MAVFPRASVSCTLRRYTSVLPLPVTPCSNCTPNSPSSNRARIAANSAFLRFIQRVRGRRVARIEGIFHRIDRLFPSTRAAHRAACVRSIRAKLAPVSEVAAWAAGRVPFPAARGSALLSLRICSAVSALPFHATTCCIFRLRPCMRFANLAGSRAAASVATIPAVMPSLPPGPN